MPAIQAVIPNEAQKEDADLMRPTIIGCSQLILRHFWRICNPQFGGEPPNEPPQADLIRNCVRDNFITPAKSAGMAQLRVRSGDVHRALGLTNKYPAVCSAMSGQKIQELCNVRVVAKEGNVGANFHVTYLLSQDGG